MAKRATKKTAKRKAAKRKPAKKKAKKSQKRASYQPTPGRPTKLTPAVERTICEAIGKGHTLRRACGIAGVHERNAQIWHAQGRKDLDADRESIHANFAAAIARARALACEVHVERISTASKADWRASAWLLSRLFPDDYGEHQTVTVEDGSALDAIDDEVLDQLTDGELELVKRLRDRIVMLLQKARRRARRSA